MVGVAGMPPNGCLHLSDFFRQTLAPANRRGALLVASDWLLRSPIKDARRRAALLSPGVLVWGSSVSLCSHRQLWREGWGSLGVLLEALGDRGGPASSVWGCGGHSPGLGRRAPAHGLLRVCLGLGARRAVGTRVGVAWAPFLSSVTSSLNPAWQSLTHRRDAQGRQGDLEVQLLP